LVHVSTAFVFSGELDRAYRTTDPPEPLNAYGRSKHAGELAIAAAMDDYCIVRTSWLYGLGGKSFVEDVLAQLRARNYARLALDQVGAPTWTTNLAAVLWQLARAHHRGVFHWCDNGSVNRYEFGQAIARDAFDLGLLPSRPTIYSALSHEFGSAARRPKFSTLDRTATESTLGTIAMFWRHSLRLMLQELALESRSAA
jgi:dTDP-4-dehydrorhamnose reductase